MASNSSQRECLPSSRLAEFSCAQPTHGYAVDEEWISEHPKYPGKDCFDVADVLASGESYERFVSQLRPPCKVPFPNGDVFLCGGNGNGVLQINGIGKTNAIQLHSDEPGSIRFVFTPSFSRYQRGRSQCLENLGKKLHECDKIVCVLMVREDEFSSYFKQFGKDWYVMAPVRVHCEDHYYSSPRACCGESADFSHTPQATIGQARHSIMSVARSWRLDRIWMIDDSVPADDLHKRTTSSKDHQQISMLEVLKEVEIYAVTNEVGKRDAGPLALVGIPSTFSVESSSKFEPQWNHRAATSFVYVMLQACQFSDGSPINYDQRLPYKEDVIFSARLIEAGKSVCIYRPIHFTDKKLEGDCQEYRQV